MRVYVDYTVPVHALVDTDTGYVERVSVCDEAIEATGAMFLRYSEEGPLTDEIKDKARRIADHEEWPAWDFG